jgi:YbbR domain-containing protein
MKKLKSLILNNLLLKIVSVILAVLLWLVVAQVNDPTRSKSFSGVEVTLINTDLLDQENKVYEILDNTDTVRVTVRAPQSVLERIQNSDIVAEADVSKLTDINTIAISYYISTDGSVESVSGDHDSVRLSVEDKASRYISLSANIEGEPAEDRMVGAVSLDQNMIEISGPQSSVSQVRNARVNIDVTDVSSSLSANMEIVLYDAEGNELNLSNIKKQTNYVKVSVEILTTKSVPIYATRTGSPASGYLYNGQLSVSPETVLLAGSSQVMNTVSRLTITDPVDISGATADVQQNFELKNYLPVGTSLADSDFSGVATVTVPVEAAVSTTLTVDAENLELTGVPEGVDAKLAGGSYVIYVSGLASELETLKDTTITGSVKVDEWMKDEELEELTPGTHLVPATISLGGSATLVQELLVTVEVAEPVTEEE